MDTFKEVEQTTEEGSDKGFSAVEGPEWDQACMAQDKDHVYSLLDISEEDFLKEQEPYEFHCFSGWEEAVQDWGRVPPLACIFLPQKKGKKPKNGESDHHCLLCVDFSLPSSSPSSPEYSREPPANPYDSSLKKTMRMMTLQMRTCADISVSDPECPVLTAMQGTSQLLLLREKIVEEEEKLGETQDPSSPLLPHHLASKYPTLMNRSTKHHKQTHRPTNTMRSFNGFTVLPPLKSPQLEPQVTGQFSNGESAEEEETSEADSAISVKESGGMKRGDKTRADTAASPDQTKDTYSATLTSTCHHHHLLVSAFSVAIPKRYEVALTSKADTVHRPRYSIGKHLTQALQPSSRCRKYTGPSTPQLPVLLGTKIPLLASQKLL